jgi:hypothetical protein
MDNPFFFLKCPFLNKMCTIPPQNWDESWYWLLKEQHELKLMKYIFTTHFGAFSSNVVFGPKNMNVDDV